MNLPLVHRPPTPEEELRLQLGISTFTDGSGMLQDGRLPGWRDFERVFAEWIGGRAPENKEVFDVVVVPTAARPGHPVGLSVKSKELARSTAIVDLLGTGRVYMELANSPAKFTRALDKLGISLASEWGNSKSARMIGEAVLDEIESWHSEAVSAFNAENPSLSFDLASSCYVVVSYSAERFGSARSYQVHSFSLDMPRGLNWVYLPPKAGKISCLRGVDPVSGESVIDWYAHSGGQLKYYPRAADSRFSTKQFELVPAPTTYRIFERARIYWPNRWPD